jgi:hypothetical protein
MNLREQTMLKRVCVVLCIGAFLGALPGAQAADDLYGSKGITAEAVRQGKLGSCYFHAVIAALAQRRADTIRKMIQSNSDGSYTVTFGDGKKETAYPEDLRYAHDSGYELSDGEWVAVLFRAYAPGECWTEIRTKTPGCAATYTGSTSPSTYERAIHTSVRLLRNRRDHYARDGKLHRSRGRRRALSEHPGGGILLRLDHPPDGQIELDGPYGGAPGGKGCPLGTG